jgi:hypothetical protein
VPSSSTTILLDEENNPKYQKSISVPNDFKVEYVSYNHDKKFSKLLSL